MVAYVIFIKERTHLLRKRRLSRKCCAPSPVRRTTCSPYSKASSTAQYVCAEEMGAPSVLSKKQAFVSLRIH
jgi:hypothetical protein